MRRVGKEKRSVSIGWQLAFFLSILIIIVLLITWVFQVFLLDNFYERTKRRELRHISASIAEAIDHPDLQRIAGDYAIDGTMRVSVIRLNDRGTDTVVDIDATGGMALFPTQKRVMELIQRANDNGGMYIYKITFGGKEISDNGPFEFWASENEHFERENDLQPENTRLVCINIAQNKSGETCLIILNTALLPLESTVQTLHVQFIWTAIALTFIAIIAVVVIYRSISKPLIRMNESAKQLANGKYDANFVGSGCLETHELAATLNFAATELSRVDRLQKELIANISHDLRTPLTMIKGYGELMRDIPGEMSPENMQIVIDETERLSELVNDLLDLSQLQEGKKNFACTVFNLTQTIREVLTRYDTFVHHRGYTLSFDAPHDVFVLADRKMIIQALYNLINNAINYTGDDCLVQVTQSVMGDTVRISVRDTGQGIEPDQLPMIWDRYYKVDKVHRRAMVGTGIGLSIVKEIFETHHAAYGVITNSGMGTTFWYELPIVAPPNTDN